MNFKHIGLLLSPSSMLLLIVFSLLSLYYQTSPIIMDSHIPDMCEHESVDSAAHLIFEDNIERYFISNGHHFWLLNLTNEIPNEKSALKIPFNFEPDVALLKDTSKCANGYRSLLLIQMKSIPNSNEVAWFTLEMKLGQWNSSEAIFWNEIQKIAHCDLKTETCTTTDIYFTTMSFDFKRKLDSAFGTIGNVAYYIQGEKVYKVLYKNQCIKNPYIEVIAYPGVYIGTTTTAALTEKQTKNGTTNIILFDKEVHFPMNNQNLDDINFGIELAEPSNWKTNNNDFFKMCKNTNLFFGLNSIFQDIFSGSKRHYYLRRIILITMTVIFISLILLMIILFIINLKCKHKEKETRPKKLDSKKDHHQKHLVPDDKKLNPVQIQRTSDNEDIILQTSC